MTLIEAKNIEKFYGTYHALKDISLAVEDGEFIALVGPSGCGKTSLLKILAGFEDQSSGGLTIAGQVMDGIPPSKRPTRMVFQKLALFPHKTIFENIGFPLQIAGDADAIVQEKVQEMFELMHLKQEYLTRYPAQLSGGEQQRVALARAMVSSPSVLLLDEPLSALDVKLKKTLQAELKRLHRTVGTTFVHVTHDLEEAMMLADRICVMEAGRVLQIGTPKEIYYRPATKFVSGFIGETNLFPCDVKLTDTTVSFSSDGIDCKKNSAPKRQAADGLNDGGVLMMVRPESISFVDDVAQAECQITGQIEDYFNKGSTIQYRVKNAVTDQLVVFEIPGTPSGDRDVGETVTVGFDLEDVYFLRDDPDA